MTLFPAPGAHVATYRIESLLGRGGVGSVYSAFDTKLQRRVAVKFLSEELADTSSYLRFQREAQMASSLNHPHIVTVHDVGEAEGRQFIVTEFVDGGTLNDWARAEKRSWQQMVELLIGVADGLASAHEANIVHRDIKPANILVARNGYAKLADFGLAKLAENADVDLTRSLTERRTTPGLIIGTIPYMSPEQALGQRLDSRSDIFSFGIVLYELLAGRRPFDGDTDVEILKAIQAPPPPLPKETPSALRQIVERALQKDPADRYQSMRALTADLRRLTRQNDADIPHSAPSVTRRRSKLRVIVTGAVAVALIAGALIGRWLLKPPSPRQFRMTQLTFDDGLTTDPTLSPDGTFVVYASDRASNNLDIYTHQIGGGAVRLTTFPEDDSEPTFSPDARMVAFRSEHAGGGIYVVPTLGGEEPRLIAPGGRRPRYSPDGKRIAYWVGNAFNVSSSSASHSYIVAAGGGRPREIAPGFAATRYPVWSPDGRQLLFFGVREASQSVAPAIDWWLIPAEGGSASATGAVKAVLPQSSIEFSVPPGQWVKDGIIFATILGRTRDVWQVGISPSGQITEKPQALTSGFGIAISPSAALDRVVFSGLNDNDDIWSLPLAGNIAKVSGPMAQLTRGTSREFHPELSRDGKLLAFSSNQNNVSFDLRLKDLSTGQEQVLTLPPVWKGHPVFSADGSKLAHDMTIEGKNQNIGVLYLDSHRNTDAEENLCGDDCYLPWDWSPDGTMILYWSRDRRKVGVMDVASRRRTLMLSHPKYDVLRARFSPDQKWIAFTVTAGTDVGQIFIVPFRGTSTVDLDEWISVAQGSVPRWSPDGSLLYFVSNRDGYLCLYAQRLDRTTKKPISEVVEVQHMHNARRSLSGVYSPFLEISVAQDKLAFTLNERTGNIWMREPMP